MLKRKIKYFKVLIIIFILIISFLGVIPFVFGNPDDITVYVSADAYFRDDYPDNNYGTDTSWFLFTQIDKNYRTILKFDLSDIPEGATISLAILRVNCWAVISLIVGVTDIEVRRIIDDSWIESGVDSVNWGNQPSYGIVEDTVVPAVGWVEFDIISFVQSEYNDDGVISILLKNQVEDYDTTLRRSQYRSREYNGGSAKAELYIEYSLVSDNEPFYSNVNYNNITQVGESADFWSFWEDDFNLETCKFETNNTGIAVNHTLSVSGVSSWANITLQLNYTSNVRVNYQWFCSDNASQWNSTSIYFLITTPLYITFNFNNVTMGNFYVNDISRTNETVLPHNFNQSINLVGGAFNNFAFLNFTWLYDNSIINNYNYYTSGNNTVWCYFGIAEIGGIHEDYFVLGFVIAGCSILFMVIVLKGEKKEK